jgi:hypothetical protein
MATFAIMGDRVMKTVDKDFYGLVAIDAEGYVVWCVAVLCPHVAVSSPFASAQSVARPPLV